MNWKKLKERLIDIFGTLVGLVVLVCICMLIYSVGMAANNVRQYGTTDPPRVCSK